MQVAKRSARRSHAVELKKAVLDECRAGVSVAGAAMSHGLPTQPNSRIDELLPHLWTPPA